MDILSVLLLSLAMATDAFAAAVAKGAALHRPRFSEALRTGLIFGVIEGITPLVGWGLGFVAVRYVTTWADWIAFGVLAALGVKMIVDGSGAPSAEAAQGPQRHPFWVLAFTGLATSIDAMAVGASLALIDVAIVPVAAAIGATTLVAVTAGVMLGRGLGAVAGKRAEIVGGAILLGIGTAILYRHLHPG